MRHLTQWATHPIEPQAVRPSAKARSGAKSHKLIS